MQYQDTELGSGVLGVSLAGAWEAILYMGCYCLLVAFPSVLWQCWVRGAFGVIQCRRTYQKWCGGGEDKSHQLSVGCIVWKVWDCDTGSQRQRHEEHAKMYPSFPACFAQREGDGECYRPDLLLTELNWELENSFCIPVWDPIWDLEIVYVINQKPQPCAQTSDDKW